MVVVHRVTITVTMASSDGLAKVRPLLFKQLILIFLPAKLCLVLPFHFNLKTGRAQKSTAGACLNLLVGSAYYAFHLKSAYNQMMSQEDTNFVSQLIDSYNQYAGCSILMTIILNSCYHQSDMVEITKLLQGVDEFLDIRRRGHLKWPAQFMLKFHCPSYLFVTGLCCMEYYFCIMFIKDRPTYSTYCLLMCYAPLLVHVTTELVFCAFLLCITDRLSLLQTMSQLTPTRDSKRAFDVLKRATKLLNESFEIPLLLLTFHQFTAIVTLSYDLTVAIVKYDFDTPGYDLHKIIVQLESSGGWSLFFVAETFLLCLTCERYVREFHRTGAWLLQRVASEIGGGDESLRWTQLQIVAQTKDDYAISACGLIQVDMQLLYNMIGVITTYLIILVQFDVSQRESTATASTTLTSSS